jgi:hypothetical protein
MPVTVDYSSQLEEIARALRALKQDSTPEWLIAIFSVIFGFIASVVLQIFQRWYTEHTMRRIIYSELGAMYFMLVQAQPPLVSRNAQAQSYTSERQRLRDRFVRREGEEIAKKFDGEKYAELHEDVFIQIKERPSILFLYGLMHRVVSDESLGFLVLSLMAIQNLEYEVQCGSLPRKFVRRYMGADIAARVNLGINEQNRADN